MTYRIAPPVPSERLDRWLIIKNRVTGKWVVDAPHRPDGSQWIPCTAVDTLPAAFAEVDRWRKRYVQGRAA